ncbi:hypothetical protein SeMB42_g06501 [Synchytrium endobioticum]|uniref:Uncharacterized protein n=1 Tax=Synchytrium endobioticum TaxID=286115 RepID=A0A507CLI7_9FUNG|nr:hypothetical protein SeLEV6574_g07921 [Synchytrium endobioticum]TPX39045.1 hypothetical protein SeMB42_g06501 [Synchytrium endobioticum]
MHWSNLIYLVIPSVVLFQLTDAFKVDSSNELVAIESTKEEVGHHLYKRMYSVLRLPRRPNRSYVFELGHPLYERLFPSAVEEHTPDPLRRRRNFARKCHKVGNSAFLIAGGLTGVGLVLITVYLIIMGVETFSRKPLRPLPGLEGAGQLAGAVICSILAYSCFSDAIKGALKFEEDATSFSKMMAPLPPSMVTGDIEMGHHSHPVLPMSPYDPPSVTLHTSSHDSDHTSTSLGSGSNSNGAGLDSLQL